MDCYLNARPRDQLKAHCKAGRLFDAQKFLEEAGTARLRKTRKWTPLFVAVDRGFHSLVEVLLRYDHAQWDLEKSYRAALSRRRSDLAGMILRSPSWSTPIDPIEALATGDLTLAESLKRSGVDLVGVDSVLKAAARNAGGVLAVIDHLGIWSREVEDQLYSAMVTHASLGHIPSVMRLLRRGFDPHREVPYLDEVDGEVCDEGSAVLASMYSDKPGLFAALRPDPKKDDAEQLLRTAVFSGCDKMLKTLLDAGFNLNCKDNGGSPALDVLLGDVVIGSRNRERSSEPMMRDTRYMDGRIRELMERVRHFVGIGARWVPDPKDRALLSNARDVLLSIGADRALGLIEILEGENAVSRDDVALLLGTARMKDMAGMWRQRI
ncbi:hypothetical protein N9Z83_02620 [Akkermansiaceae bacterium]|nr:hypothetical protein [Akkermansiaceae bacterium]